MYKDISRVQVTVQKQYYQIIDLLDITWTWFVKLNK